MVHDGICHEDQEKVMVINQRPMEAGKWKGSKIEGREDLGMQ
jgi:hypothetical protein